LKKTEEGYFYTILRQFLCALFTRLKGEFFWLELTYVDFKANVLKYF